MKNLKYYLFFVLVFCLSLHSKAQHSGNINKFEILPEYLVNGKIKISDGPETIIKYKVTFAREMATTVPKITWKPFNMKIRLSAGDKNNNIVLFDSPYTITSADFGENDAFIKDKVFSGTIINSKLYQGNPIILAFTTDGKDFPIGAFEGKMYNFDLPTVVNPPVVTPPIKADSIPIWAKLRTYDGGNLLSSDPNEAVPYDGIQTRDKVFYAYNKQVSGTVAYYEHYFDYKEGYPRYDYIYKENTSWGHWTGPTKNIFYAFPKQAPGTVPVYVYTNQMDKGYFYSTVDYGNSRYKSLGIAFYAYPVPEETGPTRPGRPAGGGSDTSPSEPTGPGRPTRGGR